MYLKGLTVEEQGGNRLEDIRLLVREGECVCMVSAARQKETLVHYLQGKGRRISGSVQVRGREISQDGRRNLERNKVFVVGTGAPCMSALTIGENIFLLRRNSLKKIFLNEKAIKNQAEYYFQKYGISLDAGADTSALSQGEKVMVALIRCVSQGARLVVLHDISSVFSREEMGRVAEILGRLKAEGIGLLVSDNHPEYFYGICDCMVIFKHRRIAEKIYEPEKFPLGEQIVLRGTEAPEGEKNRGPAGRPDRPEPGEPLEASVEIRGKTAAGWEYCLRAGKGEIVLLSQPAVKREQLWDSLSGRLDSMPFYELDGNAVRFRSMDEMVRGGVVFVSMDGDEAGEFKNLTREENVLLPSLKRISGWMGFYERQTDYILTDDFLFDGEEKLEELTVGRDGMKLVLYRWKLYHPKVMILRNLFTAADLKERDWLKRMVTAIAARGTVVLLLENEQSFCAGFADRIESGER